MMHRVYIKTYGCQMNVRDSEAVAALLTARGYEMVGNEEQADIILLNTCAVRDLAEQKALGKMGRLLRERRRSGRPRLLGVLGCMAQNRGTSVLDQLPDLDLLAGTQKFHRVPEMLDRLRNRPQAGVPPSLPRGSLPKNFTPDTLVDLGVEEGSQNTIRDHVEEARQVSAFVSIMQGCNMNCTFCIVPKTRGPERARPIADIVEECRDLAAQGTREVTLLGQIVTSYGRREIPFRDGISPFVQLIEAVNEIDGIERIRFTSPHPRGFKRDLVEAYGRIPKLCPSVHLPVQSGSDRILKRMNRPYTVRKYREIVEALREQRPELFVSTDIIVGFPGETEEDFAATAELFETVRFDMAFIFKYSRRSSTVAAEEMTDDIPQEVKETRNQHLLKKLEATSLASHQRLVGQVREVLVEGPARRGENLFTGRLDTSHKAIFPAHERLIGQIVPIHIHEATVTTLRGELQLEGVDEAAG